MLLPRLPIMSRATNRIRSAYRYSRHCSHIGRFDLLKLALALFLLGGASVSHAQASYAATRMLDVQVGGTYANGNSDTARSRFNGFGIYGDVDFKHHFGVEGEFHFISDQDPDAVYEKTYEIGGRYFRHYGRFSPYGKALYGRGVFNYPPPCCANLAYNIIAFGAGTDIRILRHLNGRVDYEYQKWFSFSPNAVSGDTNHVLSPSLISAGFAYHF